GRGARARILEASRFLFRHRGINATGVAELAAAAHVSKRTLYQHFAGKDELIAAYLQTYTGDDGSGPESALARADLTPRARLLEMFGTLADDAHPMRGCPFVNAAAELADPRHPAHRLAAEHKRRFAERLADLAREAGARNADQIGRRLALLYDGAAAQVVVSDSAEAVATAHAMAAAMLDAAIAE
ncbi:MAG: TetR family transcriptional regulator, partial [Solirubrobacteraceae bacterium]